MSGGQIYKLHRRGGLNLLNFEDLLREKIMKEIFWDDAIFYLQVLFADQRGWNIRNLVCHGIQKSDYFNVTIADRIFHSLLLLAQVKKQQNGNDSIIEETK
jgi:hypothetical protein